MLIFYGIISNRELSEETSPPPSVFMISYKSIAGVVESTDEHDLIPTRGNIIHHQEIISDILEQRSIIPARFGTIFASGEEVELFLGEIYENALELLAKIKNKIELGMKVFWKKDSFNEMVNTTEVKALKNKIMHTDSKNAYYLEMQLGEKVQRIVEENREYYIDQIHNKLKSLAHDERLNELLDVKMVFNAAYLVDKLQLQAFSLKVEKLFKVFEPQFTFSYSGPWAPYNFTTLKINIQNS
jgi:hypothetical protein